MNSLPRKAPRRGHAELGGVLVELALIVPLIFLFIGGAFTAGRILSQLTWMSQTAYQTYLEGTEYLLAADRDPRMIQRSDDLELYNRNLSNNARALKTPGMISTLSLDGERLTASITGTIDTGFSPLRSVPLKISVTGPLLALDNGAAGDLSSFENSTRLFDNNEVSCDAAIVGCAISPVRSCSQNRPCDCSCSGSFCPNYGALICP